jgi:urease accessory protein
MVMNKRIVLLTTLFLMPTLAHAHIVGTGGGFLAGLSHPVLGADHLLAMVSVGILSAQMGGRAIWTVPSTFIGVMLIGGILGMQGIPLFSVELGIAFSVLVLGAALAAEKRLPPVVAMLFVGFFALFHGHAHGTEMPSIAQPALYALGFVTGTASIHICGVLIGLISQQTTRGADVLRFVGVGIAGVGIHLLLG